MSTSAEISREIYERLGPDGLAARTTAEWDARTVRLVRDMLNPGQRILDLGCGYGRIAIPLAQDGFEIVGIDISELMLSAARDNAASRGVAIEWLRGDMCQIPLADCSFDVVLCLWLTFHELLQKHEQLTALAEMIRVLKPGGWALLDGPPFHGESFSRILSQAGISTYDSFIDDCPGRPRQFLRFRSDAEHSNERP